MARKSYSDEFKNEVIQKASEIGAPKAAKEAGVSYQTLLKWMKSDAPAAVAEGGDTAERISQVTAEIEELNASLKEKKDELKALQRQLAKEAKEAAKQKAAEEKAAEKKRQEEQMKELLSALEKSGKSYEEIMELLV